MATPVQSFTVEKLPVKVYTTGADLAAAAAGEAHACLAGALAANGSAAVILATGNSQIQFLDELVKLGGIDWSRVTLFHMDEYLGIAGDHKASFRRYMRERVETKIKPKQFHYLIGDALEPIQECERYAALLRAQPIDLCCLGVGDNGHLAFNDPPVANFHDSLLVKIIALDLVCRQQQVNQGHFPDTENMPHYALTLTIPALLSAKKILTLVPGKHKASIIRTALRGPMTTQCPASILRQQPHATLLLDKDSAALL
ncbi:MAG: glucosamine-6-phosphate deaminase [Verrucomicrobiota bacterium]